MHPQSTNDQLLEEAKVLNLCVPFNIELVVIIPLALGHCTSYISTHTALMQRQAALVCE